MVTGHNQGKSQREIADRLLMYFKEQPCIEFVFFPPNHSWGRFSILLSALQQKYIHSFPEGYLGPAYSFTESREGTGYSPVRMILNGRSYSSNIPAIYDARGMKAYANQGNVLVFLQEGITVPTGWSLDQTIEPAAISGGLVAIRGNPYALPESRIASVGGSSSEQTHLQRTEDPFHLFLVGKGLVGNIFREEIEDEAFTLDSVKTYRDKVATELVAKVTKAFFHYFDKQIKLIKLHKPEYLPHSFCLEISPRIFTGSAQLKGRKGKVILYPAAVTR